MKIFEAKCILKLIGLGIGIAIATTSFTSAHAENSQREISNREGSNREVSNRKKTNRESSNREEFNTRISNRKETNRRESNREESIPEISNREEFDREESISEISEIGWNSRLSSMGLDKKKNANQKYKFECQSAPEDLIHAPVWGTKVYTSNSGICSAAVHSGMIDPDEGGVVTVKLVKGRNFYTGSKKNDVKSEDRAGTDMSFVFVGQKKVQEKDSDDKHKSEPRKPSALERVLMDGFTRGVERTIDRAITDMLD